MAEHQREIDPSSDLAKRSIELARELITARLSALDFSGEESSKELIDLWSPAISRVLMDALGEEARGLDWSVVDRLNHLVAALSYLGASIIGEVAATMKEGESPDVQKAKALAIWQEMNTILAKQDPPYF